MSVFCVSAAVQKWRSEGRVAVWLHIPILQSRFIAPAASLGFCFHHAESDSSMLSLWLGDGPSRLPGYATHQVGVAGQFQTEDNQNQLFRGLPDFFLELEVKSLSCVRLCDPMDCSPPGFSVHGTFPGKNTRVGCHFLLQEIFPTQVLNPSLPHCRQAVYRLIINKLLEAGRKYQTPKRQTS